MGIFTGRYLTDDPWCGALSWQMNGEFQYGDVTCAIALCFAESAGYSTCFPSPTLAR